MNWQPPTELPDLRRTDIVSLDIETKDDRLAVGMGSGWPFGAGYICGLSVAWREGEVIRSEYFPLRHPDSNNFDPAPVFEWLRDLATSDVHIVTQNGLYDWGWLRTDAGLLMPPAERLEEIGALATLVDENRFSYSLETLCAWRGLQGKDLSLLEEGAAAIGLSKHDEPRANLWRMPARFVGPYAEADAANTLALFENLNPILDREGTRDAYRLEVELLPMVHEMRRRGIRVDVAAAERARDLLLPKRDAALTELSARLGANVSMTEIAGKRWLAVTFDQHGIKYPHTKKGNPSFTSGKSGWMQKHPHWLPQLIVKANKYNKAVVDFLEGHILRHVVNGRIHAEIHPHRSDDNGTRSLRFSYSNPPLQQMAARDEEIAPLIRGCFLPDEGEVWAKPDISQQEFRFITHYAVKFGLQRAQEAADRYRADPNADFHAMVAAMTGLDRSRAKDSNFAKSFGAGVRKFAAMIGKSESEAAAIMDQYDRALPFVHQLSKRCENLAARQGYLELYDGARRHWSDWVAWADWTKGAGPCPLEEAERRINDPIHPWFHKGPLRRADAHKAMNALIQGSAARHTKLWMRAVWREGIVPLVQMHDCLDCSVSSPEQAELVAKLGREAVTLEVPIQVDLKYGRNWADATHSWEELHNGAPTIMSATAISITPEMMPANISGELVMPGGATLAPGTTPELTPADDEDELDNYTAGSPAAQSEPTLGDGDPGAEMAPVVDLDDDLGDDRHLDDAGFPGCELAPTAAVDNAPAEPAPPPSIDFGALQATPKTEEVADGQNGAEADARLWATPVITEVPAGSVEFEAILASLSAEDRAVVWPAKANGGGEQANQRAVGNGHDQHAGEPYAPASTITLPPLAELIGQSLSNGKITCPFHNDGTASLHIYPDHFHCFGCGAHGDHIDWLMRVEGMSREQALHMLATWQGPRTRPISEEEQAEEARRKLARAAQLWDQAGPIAGTLAERYLAEVRRININALPSNIDVVLRFHPRCDFSPGIQPCLIALFCDVVSDAPAGIHRIALPSEVFAGAKVERKMLGPWSAPRAIKLWPATDRLYWGEGIETVAAAATHIEHRGAPMQPAWAAGSSGNLTKLPIIPGVERLGILVDPDDGGRSAARTCGLRWAEAGRTVALLIPRQPQVDFNDLLMGNRRAQYHH